MFGIKKDPQAAGGVITARRLNRAAGHANRLDKIRVGPGMGAWNGPGGILLSRTPHRIFYAKLNAGGTGGVYGWLEQWALPAGTFADGVFSFGAAAPQAAREINGNDAIPIDGTVIVQLRYSAGGTFLFQLGTCS